MSSSVPLRPDVCKTPVQQSTKPRSPNAPPRVYHRDRSASVSSVNRRLFDEAARIPARGVSFSAPEIADEDFTQRGQCLEPLYNENEKCPICWEVMGHCGGGIAMLTCRHGFCIGCVMVWSEDSHTCPLCNQNFNEYYVRVPSTDPPLYSKIFCRTSAGSAENPIVIE